jgi:hypothetical protein
MTPSFTTLRIEAMFLRNGGWLLTDYTALYPRRQSSSQFNKLTFLFLSSFPFQTELLYLHLSATIISFPRRTGTENCRPYTCRCKAAMHLRSFLALYFRPEPSNFLKKTWISFLHTAPMLLTSHYIILAQSPLKFRQEFAVVQRKN